MLLVILIIYLVKVIFHKKKHIEHFSLVPESVKKKTSDIYDKFYCEVYDELFKSDIKNEFESMLIHKDFLSKNKTNNILDLGCGTGCHVKILSRYGYNLTGLDQSKYMIKQAKLRNHKNKVIFNIGDFHNTRLFKPKTFTAIICLFFTIYYCKNLNIFFKNCNNWLKHHGYLFIHIVNRDRFDPVLDKSSSLIPFFDPQRYTDKRATKTLLSFNEFKYQSDWDFKSKNTVFQESFDFPESKRVNIHKLHLYKQKHILKIAKKFGFKLVKVYDESIIGYKYNFIWVLEKIYG